MHVPGERQFVKIFDGYRIGQLSFEESWNVAPTQQIPVIRSIDGVREIILMRWGLVPYFAKGLPPKYSTINARIETVKTNSCYRDPWKRGQRCIIIAEGFYEWHMDERGKTQPFYIKAADQEIFGFAGLWNRSTASDGTALESCTMITMPANALMADVHNSKVHSGKRIHLPPEERRMPAMLKAEDWEKWLTGSTAEADACLNQYPANLMAAWPVSSRVNTPKNNDAELTKPADAPPPEPTTGDLFE